MHCALLTVYLRLCMDRCRNVQEIQNSFLFCISFVFILWPFYCGQGLTDGSSVWQLALCQVHTRTCSHCIPRCSSMCMCVRVYLCVHVPVCACTCACMYLCTHSHMHNRYPIVFTSVMNSNVLISTNYRSPPTDRFLEKFTLRQPTDETLYACQIFNGAGTVELRQYCRL